MNDELAFLNAIQDQPADDTARLVFADWLDDHGQGDRAEFIRTQCELARIEADPSSFATGSEPGVFSKEIVPKVRALRRREWELFLAHAVVWLTGLPGADEYPALHSGCRVTCGIGPREFVHEYVFRRGFPEMKFDHPSLPTWLTVLFPISREALQALARQSEPVPTPT